MISFLFVTEEIKALFTPGLRRRLAALMKLFPDSSLLKTHQNAFTLRKTCQTTQWFYWSNLPKHIQSRCKQVLGVLHPKISWRTKLSQLRHLLDKESIRLHDALQHGGFCPTCFPTPWINKSSVWSAASCWCWVDGENDPIQASLCRSEMHPSKSTILTWIKYDKNCQRLRTCSTKTLPYLLFLNLDWKRT